MVERKDLVVGKQYFMDGSRRTIGVFRDRDKAAVYFLCDNNSSYGRSDSTGKKHLTPFNLEGDGFEEVPS